MANRVKGVRITEDNLQAIVGALQHLTDNEVLVGFPEKGADHKGVSPLGADTRQETSEINNATLGYIHEHGAPEVNLPARPFLGPGVEKASESISGRLVAAIRAALKGDKATVERNLNFAGIEAQISARNRITEGLDPPLSSATLRARLARVPSRKAEAAELARRAQGQAPSTDLVKPLIDTGQLRNAIAYVIKRAKPSSP